MYLKFVLTYSYMRLVVGAYLLLKSLYYMYMCTCIYMYSVQYMCGTHVHVPVLPEHVLYTGTTYYMCESNKIYILFLYTYAYIHVSYIIHVLESIIIIHCDVYTFTCALVSSPFSFTLFPKWINCPFRPWFVNFLSTLIDTR